MYFDINLIKPEVSSWLFIRTIKKYGLDDHYDLIRIQRLPEVIYKAC